MTKAEYEAYALRMAAQDKLNIVTAGKKAPTKTELRMESVVARYTKWATTRAHKRAAAAVQKEFTIYYLLKVHPHLLFARWLEGGLVFENVLPVATHSP
jgi:hypothetical protein